MLEVEGKLSKCGGGGGKSTNVNVTEKTAKQVLKLTKFSKHFSCFQLQWYHFGLHLISCIRPVSFDFGSSVNFHLNCGINLA